MVFWSPYSWYFDPLSMVYRTPIHGISNSTSIVYWTPYPRYLNPYPWYVGPSIHGILTPLPIVFRPLPMACWPPYPWYFYPSTHVILNPYPWYVDPISMEFWPPPMVYRILYPWYFDPLSMVLWPTCLSLDYQWGVSKYHAGSKYHGWKFTPGSKYHWCQNTIWHWQRWQWMIWALMKQLSIAQCSGNPTYWNTSYEKVDHLAVQKSFISSFHILFSKEHDDFFRLYWIPKLHKNP